MAKAEYSKPASQVDLEERQKKDYTPSTVLRKAVDPAGSDNGYVGVDPIYQNAANDTERPIQAEKGAEAKVFNNFLAEDVEYPEQGGDEDEDADEYEDEDEDEDEDPLTPGSNNPPT